MRNNEENFIKSLNIWIYTFLVMCISVSIGYSFDKYLPKRKKVDLEKLAVKDSLDSCILDLTTKKAMLEKTIHWRQLELIDLINEKRK